MFCKFLKELVKCFESNWSVSVCLLALVLLSVFCFAYPSKMNYEDNKNLIENAGVERTDPLHTLNSEEMSDSVMNLIHTLNSLTERVEKLSENYQSDSNLMIQKTDQMVSTWLGISTALVTIIIGLSVWNNWKQENSYRENVDKVKCELEKTSQVNKINSIMTCLNCLPDPLMSETVTERKRYVMDNISMMYDEFERYCQLVALDNSPFQNQKYIQLVVAAIKIATQKTQGVFADVSSNLCYYTFITKLNKCRSDLQNNVYAPDDLNNQLKEILTDFRVFIRGLKV